MTKKIKIIGDSDIYRYHVGGWKYALESIITEADSPYGIDCFSWLDRIFKTQQKITQPWLGFLHNVISYPSTEYPYKYGDKIAPLSKLVKEKSFLSSLKKGKGIFTLCDQTRDFIKEYVDFPVESLIHPFNSHNRQFFDLESAFSTSKRIVLTAGQWMRKYHSIYELKLSDRFQKILVKIPGFENDYREMQNYISKEYDKVILMQFLPARLYSQLISKSIVFLDLYDLAACNVLIECINLNIPICINRLPAAEQYLGKEYPLFFETVQEAQAKIEEDSLIEKAHFYLKERDKSLFSSQNFASKIVNSTLYRELKPVKYI